ncbi:MAG: DnaJ domain-containing protein [Myxococcota bacterium]
MSARLAPLELAALARIVDDLDYYQLLGVDSGAQASDIKRAYHDSARQLHPDTNRHLDAPLLSACQRVARRLSEAYCVLRDPRKRHTYDAHLADDGGPRLQLAELRANARNPGDGERPGRTPEGRQFWQRARSDLARQDWAAAIRNLQTALTFEPDSAAFRHSLERARQAQNEEARTAP